MTTVETISAVCATLAALYIAWRALVVGGQEGASRGLGLFVALGGAVVVWVVVYVIVLVGLGRTR